MVKSYSKTANHNMRRPIVKEDIVNYMRTREKQNSGHLEVLENFAHRENIPIIQHEVVAYFRFLMQTLQPKNILEIGTAIGFSALLMAENAPKASITTLDRNPEMIAFAKDNFAKYDKRKQITLIEGDALNTLPTLTGFFDFAFVDSAKSKYVVLLPEILKRLTVGGVIVFDDIFQGGDTVKAIDQVARGQRTIYRGLQKLLNITLKHPDLTTTLLPLSDGLLLIRKNRDGIFL